MATITESIETGGSTFSLKSSQEVTERKWKVDARNEADTVTPFEVKSMLATQNIVRLGDKHPRDNSFICQSITADYENNSKKLFTAVATYTRNNATINNLDSFIYTYRFSSSVSTRKRFYDIKTKEQIGSIFYWDKNGSSYKCKMGGVDVPLRNEDAELGIDAFTTERFIEVNIKPPYKPNIDKYNELGECVNSVAMRIGRFNFPKGTLQFLSYQFEETGPELDEGAVSLAFRCGRIYYEFGEFKGNVTLDQGIIPQIGLSDFVENKCWTDYKFTPIVTGIDIHSLYRLEDLSVLIPLR